MLTSEGLKAKSLTITTTPRSNYCQYHFSNWLVKKVDLVQISSAHEVPDSCWGLISSLNLNLISLAGTWHYVVARMAPGMTRWLCRLLAPAQSALRLVVHWFPSPREPAKPAIPRFQHWGCPLQLHLGRPASLRKLLNNINNNLMRKPPCLGTDFCGRGWHQDKPGSRSVAKTMKKDAKNFIGLVGQVTRIR